ncbi:MAG TPA: class F sortase [Candidatus Saccharimonadales bacterium]|nr:class F sortase [Candidatus Saccharimonadales bacterium]
MTTGKKSPNSRQSAISRLSSLWRPKKTEAGERRVRRYQLRITPNKVLLINARKFRTQSANRSKLLRQWVVPFGWFGVKELAVVYKKSSRRVTASPHLHYGRAITAAALIIGIAGAIFFGFNIHQPRALEPVTTNTHVIKQPVKDNSKILAKSMPVKLDIPAIGVDTSIVTLGLNADGSMQTPDNIYQVGWYKYSPTPGQLGPAVIAGHVDNYKGIGVFFRLRELQPNDVVEVTLANGSIAKFRVYKVEIYQKNGFPTNEVYGNINYAGIRLITCGGVFNHQTGDYESNIVAYGSLI